MKKALLWVGLDMVFLIVFNIVFFACGGVECRPSGWISYAFIHFSYLMVPLSSFFTRKSSSSAVFGFALYSVSSAYFIIEFVIGLIFIFINMESFVPSLVVQIIVAGIFAIIFISHMIANEKTADEVSRHEDEVYFIKESSSRVKQLEGKLSDKKADRQIESLYDLLHSSPSKSNGKVRYLEISILDMISELESAVQLGDKETAVKMTTSILTKVEERNRKLRVYNR